jgi:quercetin dioxygenase-like cupin family protein
MTETTSAAIEVGTRPAQNRMTIFRREHAVRMGETDTMSAPDFPQSVAESLSEDDIALLEGGDEIKLLFRQAGDDGFSLVNVWFRPDYILPRHTHNVDCTYYVVAGKIILGSQVIHAGEGFFVPAEHAYGYQAGPEGVELLEFRHSASFNIKIVDDKQSKWEEILAVAASHKDIWAAAERPRQTT